MERLTRRVSPTSYQCSRPADKFEGNELIRANQKLGKLEDIEQELGISLEVLFKALKQSKIWFKNYFYLNLGEVIENNIEHQYIQGIEHCGNDDSNYEYCNNSWLLTFREEEYGDLCVVKIKDYGKTWALTKEELK